MCAQVGDVNNTAFDKLIANFDQVKCEGWLKQRLLYQNVHI